MMKNKIYSAIVVAIFSLIGCSNSKNFFSDKVKMIDDRFEISDIISGEKLPVTGIYRISSLICFDEYLLILTPRADNVFNVFSLEGENVSRFGTIGRNFNMF